MNVTSGTRDSPLAGIVPPNCLWVEDGWPDGTQWNGSWLASMQWTSAQNTLDTGLELNVVLPFADSFLICSIVLLFWSMNMCANCMFSSTKEQRYKFTCTLLVHRSSKFSTDFTRVLVQSTIL